MRRKHQKRVLINLLVIAVLALFLWVYHEYPLPTQEMEFHRTERQVLMEESQVVWVYEGQTFSDPDILVGVSPRWIHTYGEPTLPGTNEALWPRTVTEPSLLILPDHLEYYPEGEPLFARRDAPALLAVDPPAEAESAQLTIDLSVFSEGRFSKGLDGWDPYVIQGEKSDPFFLFQVEYQYEDTPLRDQEDHLFLFITGFGGIIPFTLRTMDEFPYTLEFFDGSGALIATYTNPAGEEGTE